MDIVTEVKLKMCQECGCKCGCEEGHHLRRFLTKKERTEKLQEYAEELKKEIVAVEEHLKELKS